MRLFIETMFWMGALITAIMLVGLAYCDFPLKRDVTRAIAVRTLVFNAATAAWAWWLLWGSNQGSP